MPTKQSIFAAGLAILMAVSPVRHEAAAEGTIFETMKQKCSGDVDAYCKSVTPGEARLALCLYAHEDKVSAQCALAVYDGIVALEVSLNALGDYARTCRSDLLKFCAITRWGQGRLYTCLVENKNALAPECKSAVESARSDLQKLGVATGP